MRTTSGNYIISFENVEQKFLYDQELSGQISDGYWENSRPYNHYVKMISAQTIVEPEAIGCNFRPARFYNFNNNDLFEVVGDRMVFFIKIIRAFPQVSGIEDNVNIEDYEWISKMRELAYNEKYWADKINKLESIFGCKLEDAWKKANEVEVSTKEVRSMLKRMSAIIKMRFE